MSNERQDDLIKEKRHKSRRSPPSRRIQALADMYESKIAEHAESTSTSIDSGSTSSKTTIPVQYARLGVMDWQARDNRTAAPSAHTSSPQPAESTSLVMSHLHPTPGQLVAPSIRRVEANPVRPQGNVTMVPARQGRKYDGLPSNSGTTIPRFPSELGEQNHKTTNSEKGVMQSPKEDLNQARQPKQTYDADVRAVPAHEVFANDALPLFLPDLDALLSDTQTFPKPIFSAAREICSHEEATLYGWDSYSKRSRYELCGDQIRVPCNTSNGESTRKRKNGQQQASRAKEGFGQHETDASSIVSATVIGSKCDKVEASDHSAMPEVFPPLMLLKDNSLDELKSNAVGPRKPPGGFLGSMPGCGSLIGTFVDFIVGVEGSTLAAGVFRLQMFIDFVQVMNLNLHFTVDINSISRNEWSVNRIVLRTIPAVLSFDFVSIFGAAIIVLYILTGFVAFLLIAFWKMTRKYNPNRTIEGYASQPWLFRLIPRSTPQSNAKGDGESHSSVWTKFCNISVVVLLTVLYIPLSKLAVDALVWNSDYWPAQSDGTPTTADMQAFCYRTSLDPQDVNWAFVILPVSTLTVLLYTAWFPLQMRSTISTLLPRINRYNELGNKRTAGDLETEYMRLLSRDHSPLNFMYNAYRRRWGTYKPLYILCFKLSNLLIIGIFTNQNCLFHAVDTRKMLIIQQSILIGMQTVLLVAHISIQPFVDMLSNRSEMLSRIGYVSTAIIGLLVALQIEGSSVYKSVLLYIVQALTYSGNIYFSIASTSWFGHLVKRKQKRIDFSIDVFSPALDVAKHIKRRIWQETLSTTLLSGPEYRLPLDSMVTFSVSEEWPPYLLRFRGTAAERHIENLKILKAIGMDRYRESVDRLDAANCDAERLTNVIRRIQLDFAGVDAYWQPLTSDKMDSAMKGVSSFFGKAFQIPFPPTLVIRYDQSTGSSNTSTVQLTSLEQMEMFVWQNESSSIQRRRWVRQVLRALDGQKVYCPHTHVLDGAAGKTRLHSWFGPNVADNKRYSVAKPVFFEDGTLHVKRDAIAQNDFGPGFEVFLTYTHGQRRDADGISTVRQTLTIDAAAAFGLRDDFELTPSVDLFFKDNESPITLRLPQIQQKLHEYRVRFHHEAKEKRKVMGYAFLSEIFDRPLVDIKDFRQAFRSASCSPVVRHLPFLYPATTTLLLQRTAQVTRTRVHRWWYIFWDDLWRQNNIDFAVLRNSEQTFNPQFSSSIAYTPMPRAELETLLRSKPGLWDECSQSSQKSKGLFSPGFLNKIYFTIDELAFARTTRSSVQSDCQKGQPLAVGTMGQLGTVVRRSITTISVASDDIPITPNRKMAMYADPFAATSRYTGGGTDQDNASIVERYAWPWTEERLNGRPVQSTMGRWRARMLEWLSIRPYKVHDDTSQLFIYLRIDQGRYVAANRPGDPDAPV